MKPDSAFEIHVVINDVHVPYYDKDAMNAFLEWCDTHRPDVIHINGDFIDFPQISKYDKNPYRITELQKDIDSGVALLKEIRSRNLKAQIIYHGGNHEYRLKKYTYNTPELISLKSLSLPDLLHFDKYQIDYLAYDDPFVWRNCFIIYHGTVTRKHSGSSAKGELENWGMSGISGHTHRLSSFHKTDMTGSKVWYENGCMCRKEKVEYINGKPNWQHGFSVIFFKKNTQKFFVEQIQIKSGGFIYNGRYYGK